MKPIHSQGMGYGLRKRKIQKRKKDERKENEAVKERKKCQSFLTHRQLRRRRLIR